MIVPTLEDPVDTKAKVRRVLDQLPDECSIEDVLYVLHVIQVVEEALADAGAGGVLSYDQVMAKIERACGVWPFQGERQ